VAVDTSEGGDDEGGDDEDDDDDDEPLEPMKLLSMLAFLLMRLFSLFWRSCFQSTSRSSMLEERSRFSQYFFFLIDFGFLSLSLGSLIVNLK